MPFQLQKEETKRCGPREVQTERHKKTHELLLRLVTFCVNLWLFSPSPFLPFFLAGSASRGRVAGGGGVSTFGVATSGFGCGDGRFVVCLGWRRQSHLFQLWFSCAGRQGILIFVLFGFGHEFRTLGR